jgi:hypothetical protein
MTIVGWQISAATVLHPVLPVLWENTEDLTTDFYDFFQA